MDTPALAPRAERDFGPRLARPGRWVLLFSLVLVPRLYLLRVFDVELSNDGFDAVNTLRLLQAQGPGAIPREWLDRFILHPLYMLLLYALRLLTPESLDFYIVARFLSAVLAGVAVLLLFGFVRRAYGEPAAWAAALLLAWAPTVLWESVSILSSTLFLALYLGGLWALLRERIRAAAFLALLATLTRYEGVVLYALTLLALAWRDRRKGRVDRQTWAVVVGLGAAVPAALVGMGWIMTGNPLELVGAQSMASLWLRFLAPGDFFKRGSFFITQYPALVPLPVVWLGLGGAAIALWRARGRATALLIATTALYLVFFETLVWFNYTTLEARFLMYPGLPLLVFAGLALAAGWQALARVLNRVVRRKEAGALRAGSPQAMQAAAGVIAAAALVALVWMEYQQGMAGMRFVYNMHTSQREVAAELAHLLPPDRPTNTMIYAGVAGALDLYARERGLALLFSYFRYAPDDHPEQYLIDRRVQFIVYPVGNAFAAAKYPYLARFEEQTRGGVTFRPLTQFATTPDNQLYSIWAVTH